MASAGITPKTRIHPQAVRVLRERFDIDIGEQAPRAIDDVAGFGPTAAFDLVVTLCDKAREHLPAHDGWRLTHWSVPTPPTRRSGRGTRGSCRPRPTSTHACAT